MQLILASGSPRRQQMLRDLGLAFQITAPETDERRLRGEPALRYAQRLADAKAAAAGRKLELLAENGRLTLRGREDDFAILAADTIVVHGKNILGKPRDAAEARQMLRRLSGRTHEVITAFAWKGSVVGELRQAESYTRTRVAFSEMSDEFWKWYVSTGEPMDKAGAYAAQGIGMSFIEKVSGSYSNVVGLPLPAVLKSFRKAFRGELIELCSTSFR